ncbi:uncharacterized protein MYCFIDRAFT_27473 [Pseudocercospora fijiensis CIRAD86]|uniref:Ubiquitin 3 binding protein But2 C-terminal domain-containing protein n=1 Tax=Pseudocercospora fijiensis (strain CIRAD86) TaxID=383855 RepID=N1Q821_PSEFD|nr:uncharacterized protein MYCFIDRAFT_27473 [Pseudocercospora fijiensis CIRAD86]EME87896.1 hypothetical protein MYCFIDRAFT_27473 [Pseudocercospora fijiensis CIRAD86]
MNADLFLSGCGVVQYIATDEAQTKGSCTIFPKNATETIKDGSSDSWTLAVPVEKTPKVFGGIALRSASPIHFANVNAAELQFFLNKNTSTYCPSGVEGLDCSAFNSNQTIFTQAVNSTTLSLDVTVPGGQQVYVTDCDEKSGQLAGELKFTQAHPAFTPGPALYEGFTISAAGDLQFENKDWFACPINEPNSGYGIWSVARLEGSNAGEGCLGFSFRVVELDEKVKTAWQYS